MAGVDGTAPDRRDSLHKRLLRRDHSRSGAGEKNSKSRSVKPRTIGLSRRCKSIAS
jgi:hypothetical protein